MWNKFVGKLKKVFRKGGDNRHQERNEPLPARVDQSPKGGKKTKPRPQRFRSESPQPARSNKTVTRTPAKSERTIKAPPPVEAPADVNPYLNPYKSQKSSKTAKTMRSTTIDDVLPTVANQSQKKSERKGRKERNSMKSIGTFFDEVSRRAKKTFRFKSKPISRSRLARWTQKVEERRRRRQETPVTRSVRAYEEVFPDATTASTRRSSITTMTTSAQSLGSVSISSGKRKGNVAADGRVLLDGRPFWLEQSDDELPTDDDLLMNAEVVLEVWAGKIKLVPMPTIPIKLDPMATQSQLSDKDPLFFNKQVLFGNTVRTMINATDNCNTTSSDDRSELSACNQILDSQPPINAKREKQLTFVEPKDIVRYTANELRRDVFHKSIISARTKKGRKATSK